ncbi:RTA1 like protein-domain-containing protein [Microdochium trichocladiopsis]|uniref:RTA1 like protein-domain-containing protein n=1 Tax=Microdochium trichocladiopsis TaxID=1682393 RepID=A0A9P8XRW6_9PEZI|nr:RTA1 like protein-domain-containing protein [Microdochium trichocladiopsis]KAH7014289.1 RTA1 like protein-domain-containing protein [Microdochium trichocladiopsis]
MDSPPRPTQTSYAYVDPNFPNPGGEWDTPVIIYGYTPKFALAVFAVAWFFLLLLAHTILTIRHRSWYWLVFPVGLLFEVVGYVARSLSARQDPYHLLYFILNYFFIVTAPVFLAAGIYTVLSGLITRDNNLDHGSSSSSADGARRKGLHLRIPPRLLIAFFVVSDVIATIVQIAGAALIGVSYSKRKDPTTANRILLGGLAYQVFSMGVFVLLTASYMFSRFSASHSSAPSSSSSPHSSEAEPKQAGMTMTTATTATTTASTAFCIAFIISALAVYLRTCFRLAETAEGLGGKLQTNEVYFACLEFAPVALAVVLLAVWHPGKHVGRRILHVERGTAI